MCSTHFVRVQLFSSLFFFTTGFSVNFPSYYVPAPKLSHALSLCVSLSRALSLSLSFSFVSSLYGCSSYIYILPYCTEQTHAYIDFNYMYAHNSNDDCMICIKKTLNTHCEHTFMHYGIGRLNERFLIDSAIPFVPLFSTDLYATLSLPRSKSFRIGNTFKSIFNTSLCECF